MFYLHEAAEIAQKHSEKEQNRQAKGYNKKVKGTCLSIGDHELIANKGERGKRKLADRWNPVVYTVQEQNLQTRVYKLVDDKGNMKVVHRNLILDISFLPVESSEEGNALSAVNDTESESQDTESELCEQDFSTEEIDDRTSEWVNEMSDDAVVQGTAYEEADKETDKINLDGEMSGHQLPETRDHHCSVNQILIPQPLVLIQIVVQRINHRI